MSTESITIDCAREIILRAARKPTESVIVSLKSACGRITASDIRAANPLPTYTNSAMDGYAFRYADLEGSQRVILPIVAQSFAGVPCTETSFAPAVCIEIATGAAVPSALDTVIPYEKCDIDTENRTIAFDSSNITYGANIRYEGEQIQQGDVIVKAGVRLNARHIALLAAAGVAEVNVFKPVRVSIITTGSELVDPGHPLGRYQTYNSNAIMLKNELEAAGCVVQTASTTQDCAQAIAEQISKALKLNDIVLLTGGAGNGRFDLSQTQLSSMGNMQSWSINMRPGRPMRFGQIQDKPVFVLPGNPVAAFVTCMEFVWPVLQKMQGCAEPFGLPETSAILACDVRKKVGRAEFMRGRIVNRSNGVVEVEPLTNQSSADLMMLAQTEVILCLDHEPAHYAKGDVVRIQSLRSTIL